MRKFFKSYILRGVPHHALLVLLMISLMHCQNDFDKFSYLWCIFFFKLGCSCCELALRPPYSCCCQGGHIHIRQSSAISHSNLLWDVVVRATPWQVIGKTVKSYTHINLGILVAADQSNIERTLIQVDSCFLIVKTYFIKIIKMFT